MPLWFSLQNTSRAVLTARLFGFRPKIKDKAKHPEDFDPRDDVFFGIPLSVAGVRKKSDHARALDCNGKLTLMKRAATGNAAGQNLSSLGDELSQAESILIIDVLDLVRAEGANLLAAAGSGLGCAVSALLTLCGRAVFGNGRFFDSLNGCVFYNIFVSIHVSYETSSCNLR